MSADRSESLIEHLRGASFYFAPDDAASHRWEHVDWDDSRCQQTVAEITSIGLKLAEVPHDESGLDTSRIAQFFARFGLASKTFNGVDQEGQQAINGIMGFGRGLTQTVGSYFPLLDFTYVLRGSTEITSETIVTEEKAVHEGSHANQPSLDVLIYQRNQGLGYRLLRNGFAHGDAHHRRGDFFEEGFAGLMEHKYITKELNLTNGLLDRTTPYKLNVNPFTTYLLPGSFLRKGSEDGWVVWDTSAHAAYGMQLLVAQDPNIFDAMLTARKNPNSLREFALRVNALGVGMYDRLSRFSYKEMQFRQAANYIIEVLYDGNQEDALAAAAAQDSKLLIAA